MIESVAFADEVAASRAYLARFARRQLRNDVWVEDVVAETLLAALERPHNYGGRSSVRTWLVAILKHKIIDQLRANEREAALAIECNADAGLEHLQFALHGGHCDGVDTQVSPEHLLSAKQFIEIVDSCINELPQTTGRVFVMREWLGFSTDEICKELAISRSNVWVLLYRARLRLRESLQARWFDQPVIDNANKTSACVWREITLRM